MSAQHHNLPARNGQTSNIDNQIIQDWIAGTNQTLDTLLHWRFCLKAWQAHPNTSHISDEVFTSVIQDLTSAGLSEWLDANPAGIDALRATVTGGNK